MISNTGTSFQFLTNGATISWPFANKIFEAQDLSITLITNPGTASEVDYAFTYIGNNQFQNLVLALTATVSNIDVDSGATVTFNSAPLSGYTLDLRSNVSETQSTSIKNQTAFLPDLHEEFFDRITRELQDLARKTYLFGIHGPDTESAVWPALPGPAARAGTQIGFDGTGALSLLTSPATAFNQTLFNAYLSTSDLYPLTGPEEAAGMTSVASEFYPPGDPRRYGADGTGVADSTTALNLSLSVVQQTTLGAGLTFSTTGNLTMVAGASLVGPGTLTLSGGSNALLNINNSNCFVSRVAFNCAANTGASKVAVSIGGSASNVEVSSCVLTQARILTAGANSQIRIFKNVGSGTCIGGTSGGLIAIAASGSCSDFSVQDNQVSGTDGSGFSFSNGCIRGVISGNRSSSNAGCGMYCQSLQDCAVTYNLCYANQLTGIGWNNATPTLPQRSSIIGNICVNNYQDGIDVNLNNSAAQYGYLTIANNYCENNGQISPYGTGINLQYVSLATVTGNILFGNGLDGIRVYGGSNNAISANLCIANGEVTPGTYNGITLAGATNCTVTGNQCTNLSGGANQNYGIAETGAANGNIISGNNCTGNLTGTVLLAGNLLSILRDDIGGYLDQVFTLAISNNAGTLQHSIYAQPGSNTLGSYQSRINNASASVTNTPTGTDATTAMAAGGKIGSANTNYFWMDTAPQINAQADLLAVVGFNSSGSSVQVSAEYASININGVTQNRLVLVFTVAGAAFALTTANIAAGKTIQIQFKGKLS